MNKSFLFSFYLSLSLLFSNSYCPNKIITTNPIDKDIDEEIYFLSNRSEIAKSADDTLSKLIAAKSPMIINWIKERNLNPASDAELIAKKWREYYANVFILSTYPMYEEKINSHVEKLFQRLNNQYFTKNKKDIFQIHFENAKKFSLEKINASPLLKEDKTAITEAIKKIKLYFPKELKNSKYSKNIQDFFHWGIAYDPIASEINLGLQSFKYRSNETLEAVFAHEIAHAFDACHWTLISKTEWPFKKIGECLRAYAKPRDDSKIDELVKNGKLDSNLAESLKANPTCNKKEYPVNGLQADQLNETFADWFSSEVTATLAKDEFRFDLCETKKLSEGSSYLTNEDRLNKIYLANPILQKKYQIINNDIKYCSF